MVGFISDHSGRALKVVALAGGPPRTLVSAPLGTSGATWGSDGYIYFDADAEGLRRIRPDGNVAETLMPLDTANHETGIAWPHLLPDNKVVLMRMRRASDAPADFSIIAARVGSRERRLITRGVAAWYADGYLLFAESDGTLECAPFDERSLSLTGPARTVATGVRISGTYAGVDLTLTDDGTLFYVTGASGAGSRLQWVSREGTVALVDSAWHEDGEIRGLALSPDGTRAAVELSRSGIGGSDIWIKQLPAGPLTRLTLDAADDRTPSWTADGRNLLFISARATPNPVFERRSDGAGSATVIGRADRSLSEAVESSDGRWLVARTNSAEAGGGDIMAMQIGRDSMFKPIIATPAGETNPALSPDGHWLAYVSTESGRREVYVRPFPNVNAGVWQVSSNGGVEPRWSHAGSELYFRSITLMDVVAVPVTTTPVFKAGAPRMLFHSDALIGFDYPRFDVSPDDKRFLMVSQGGDHVKTQLVRVENFIADMKRRRAP
jgi:serine/threonine-protein kinase